MKKHSEYSFRNNLVLNIKYWLWGSFISFNIGWGIIIFTCILEEFFPKYYYNVTKSSISSILLYSAPFVGALLIKFIKKDMPCYFYSTIGLIYGITYFCFSDCAYHFLRDLFSNHGIKNALHSLYWPWNYYYYSWVHGCILNFMITMFIPSFLGGFLIGIYQYFKLRNSERKLDVKINIIELIIVICVIAVALVWSYNFRYSPYCNKGDIYYNKNYSNCPKCGSTDIKCFGIINDGSGDTDYLCNKCRWKWTVAGYECPECGNVSRGQINTGICNKCGYRSSITVP